MDTSFKVDKIKHVAIIMDGNGRWAEARTHRRVWGHVRGSNIVSEIVEKSDDLGVEALTLYTFSTENWSRPPLEVKTLFRLLKKFIQKERKRIIKNGIKFRVIGNISKLPDGTKDLIAQLEDETKDSKGLKLTFAFGYGGRSEIVSAIKKIVENGEEVSEESISKSLFAPESGDVDLLIRTGGDQRISNFLLWQLAYAELFFTPTMWPEFTVVEFEEILKSVEKRERRFGSVCETKSLKSSKDKALEHHELY